MKGKMKNAAAIGVFAIAFTMLLSGCTSPAEQGTVHEFTGGPVSYLGPEGTYTEEATQLFFGEEGEYLPQKTVADAVQQLLDGNCVYAVIPQENTLGGPVYDYVDELLSHETLSIVGEVELPIRQALLTAEGTAAEDIEVVYSHPQGILQGAAWLAENLPDAEVIEVSSTAEGAKMVSESGSADCAAIASAGAADVYGLQVFAENIQQTEANKTRFYVLSDAAAATAAADRMAFTASGAAEDLPALLAAVSKSDLALVCLHDRPEKTTLGSYIYLIECTGGGYEAYEAVSRLEEFTFRYYGSFSVR